EKSQLRGANVGGNKPGGSLLSSFGEASSEEPSNERWRSLTEWSKAVKAVRRCSKRSFERAMVKFDRMVQNYEGHQVVFEEELRASDGEVRPNGLKLRR